jgi:hypothetical protein
MTGKQTKAAITLIPSRRRNEPIFDEQPSKYCPKCGSLIPDNKEVLTAWDEACRRARLRHAPLPEKPRNSPGLVACENCARIASKGMPALQKRRRKGDVHEDQSGFVYKPGIPVT